MTTALDPATGRTLWTAAALRDPVAGPSYAVAAGVRIVRWRDGTPATLPGWRLLPPAEGSAAAVGRGRGPAASRSASST